jgi:hypothetical protein
MRFALKWKGIKNEKHTKKNCFKEDYLAVSHGCYSFKQF